MALSKKKSKLLENHTLHSGTYLYSPYMAVPPQAGKLLETWITGSRTRDPGQRTQDRGPMTENPGQRTQVREPNSEVPGQRTQNPGPRTEDPIQRT